MTVSSADPGELRTYATRAAGALDDVGDLVPLAADALAALQAAMPEPFRLHSAADLDLPAVGRARAVDAQVATTADAFDRAGRGDGGGVVSVDDSALPPVVRVYDQATLDALARRLAAELASVRERLGAGAPDETTLAELLGLLVTARALTDRAETDGRGAPTAAALIEHMGPGDLRAMLAVLEAATVADGSRSPAAGAIEDLALLVSRGLEAQPDRAERWVGALTARHPWVDGPPEALVALAALGAPTTRTFGLAVWDAATRPRPGVPGSAATPHDARPGGLLGTMFGTTHAPQAIARAAADRPALANGIVRAAGAREFEALFGDAYHGRPRPVTLAGDLDALLLASVDARLPLDDRIDVALHAMAMVNEAGDLDRCYRDPTLTALGTMTRPLLANLAGSLDTVVVGASAGGDGTEAAAPLWDAVASLGATGAGTAGLRAGIAGAVDDMLARGATGSATEPIRIDVLEQVGRLRAHTVTTVGRERLDALEARVAATDPPAASLESSLLDAVGATPVEPVSVLIEAVRARQRGEGADVPVGGSLLGPHAEAAMTYRLVLADLAAAPDLASPQLVAGLHAAGIDGATDDDRGSAVVGILDFLLDDRVDASAYPGLSELRELLRNQRRALHTDTAEALDDVHS